MAYDDDDYEDDDLRSLDGAAGKKKPAKAVYECVKKDIQSLRNWRETTERLGRERLSERKKSVMYHGAPNFVVPIIDDNIRSKVAQEMSVMFSSRQLANFIPLSKESSDAQRHAEVGFDAMLRLMLNFRSKMENALETKMERGFSVLKQVENADAYGMAMGKQFEIQMVVDEMTGIGIETMVELPSPVIPDVEVVDQFDFVVPSSTKNLQSAERIAHIHRYSVREFREIAEASGWQNADEVIRVGKEGRDDGDAATSNGLDAGSRPSIGLRDVSDEISRIEVWECFHYVGGDRYRSVVCPCAPDIEIQSSPWAWADTGEPRPWPFVQLRSENRRLEFYDTRGDAELLLDNQKAASSYLNAKGIQLDFFAKPMLTGPRGATEGIKWVPGEVLPENVSPVQMPRIDGIFDYSADMERANAARRSGASQGSYGDTRMGGDKTATQVNAESMTAQRLTNVSVLRDGEPMSALYQLMWDFLRHNPVALPMVNESRQFQGQISMEIFQLPFRVESAASSQQANPDFVLQQMMSLGQFLVSNPFIRQYEFAKILIDQINPQMTNRLVYDPTQDGQGGIPLEQQVAQNTAQVGNLTKYVGTMAQADMQEQGEVMQ